MINNSPEKRSVKYRAIDVIKRTLNIIFGSLGRPIKAGEELDIMRNM